MINDRISSDLQSAINNYGHSQFVENKHFKQNSINEIFNLRSNTKKSSVVRKDNLTNIKDFQKPKTNKIKKINDNK